MGHCALPEMGAEVKSPRGLGEFGGQKSSEHSEARPSSRLPIWGLH